MTHADLVNHPPHYKGNRFESIDIIEAYGLGFYLGNAFKYIARHNKKGGRQDIEKALWYLRRILDNGTAYVAQFNAWRTVIKFGVDGIEPDEIIRDFGIRSFALEQAMAMILAAPRSGSPLSCLIAAKGSVTSYLEESANA